MKDLITFAKMVLLSSNMSPNFLNFRVVIVIEIDNSVLIQLFIVLPSCLKKIIAEFDNSGNKKQCILRAFVLLPFKIFT